MTPERHARVSEVFAAVVERPRAERAALLDQLCADDSDLRRQVERLLGHDQRPAVLDTPIETADLRDAIAETDPGLPLPARIGAYEVLGVLGQGGMGTVYRARQARPARLVALKLLNPALLTRAMVTRFEFETQIMAGLHHPGIAEIYEAGTADLHGAKVPFFAMELVSGRTLTAHADAKRLDRRARLALLRTICEAVHHAHQRGVIHRDLKPGNILVTEAGVPKVLDFGVACTALPELRTLTLQTRPGQIVGTLPYMSPEQIAGHAGEVDVRSDIYALGVIAYELLSGRLPHDLSGTSLADAVRTVETAEPTPLGRLDPALRGDIETIVSKAMDKSISRRYGSAAELGREIDRHLAGEAIEARRDSRSYVLRRALVRHRVPVAFAGVLAVVLAGATGVSVVFGMGEARQRRLADERAEETERVARFQAQMFQGIDVEAMGRGLKAQLRDQVRAGLERSAMGDWPDRRPRTAEDVERLLSAFDDAVAPAQGADVARAVLDSYLLGNAAQALEAQFAGQPQVRADLHVAIGEAYRTLGMDDRAELHLRRALALRSARDHGAGSEEAGELERARGLTALAGVLQHRGQYAEAEPMYREALDLFRKELGPENPDGARVLVELATLLANRRDPGAPDLFDEAIALSRRVHGDGSGEVAGAMSNYGEMVRRNGDLAGAEAAHGAALKARRASPNGDTKDVAISLNNLANVLTEAGRYAEAEPLQRESLDLQRRLRGAEHPDAVASLHNLANTWRAMGMVAEAEAAFREAIALHRRLQPEANDPSLARSLTGLALVLQARSDYAAAEPMMREASAIFATLGPEHPDYATSLCNLATLLHFKGDLGAAEPLYRQGLQIRRGLPHYEHVDVAGLLNNFAALLRDKGDFAAAEPTYAEAIVIYRRVAQAHPGLSISLAGLARVLDAQSRHAEAEPVFREALALQTQQLPPGHEQTAATKARLGATVARLGRFSEAEELLLSVASQTGQPGQAAPTSVLIAVGGLVDTYQAWQAADPNADHRAESDRWNARLAELRAPAQR
jgi:eukaryotic-like serine/threonine-protein kinase